MQENRTESEMGCGEMVCNEMKKYRYRVFEVKQHKKHTNLSHPLVNNDSLAHLFCPLNVTFEGYVHVGVMLLVCRSRASPGRKPALSARTLPFFFTPPFLFALFGTTKIEESGPKVDELSSLANRRAWKTEVNRGEIDLLALIEKQQRAAAILEAMKKSLSIKKVIGIHVNSQFCKKKKRSTGVVRDSKNTRLRSLLLHTKEPRPRPKQLLYLRFSGTTCSNRSLLTRPGHVIHYKIFHRNRGAFVMKRNYFICKLQKMRRVWECEQEVKERERESGRDIQGASVKAKLRHF